MQGEGYLVEIDLNIKTDEFEGPIGLLLTLITKNKLDITRISLVKIVDQFINYSEVNKPDLKTYAEFIRVSSILLYLKTVAILNSSLQIDEEMEVETQSLLNQLEEMKVFRDLRDKLKEKRLVRVRKFSKSVKKSISNYRQYTLDDILKYAVKYFVNIQRTRKFSLKRNEIDINEKVEEVKRWLILRSAFPFSEFVSSKPTIHVIASFLAVLETTKSDITKLYQERNFDEITVMRKE